MSQQSFDAFDAHLRADRELMGAAHEASEAVEREELAFLDHERAMSALRERVSTIESRIMAEVVRERDGDKMAFTNESARKAEHSLRLSNDPSHRDAVRGLAEAIQEQGVREIRIKKLLRDYALAKLSYESLTLGRRER